MVEESTAASDSLTHEATQRADLVGQFRTGSTMLESKARQAPVPQLKASGSRMASVVAKSADERDTDWEEL